MLLIVVACWGVLDAVPLDTECWATLVALYGGSYLADTAYLGRAARVYLYYERSRYALQPGALFKAMEKEDTESDLDALARSPKKSEPFVVRYGRYINDTTIFRVAVGSFIMIFAVNMGVGLAFGGATESTAHGCRQQQTALHMYIALRGAPRGLCAPFHVSSL